MMKNTFLTISLIFFLIQSLTSQNFGNFEKIEKQKLLNDVEILYQALDKFHSGMYWYTPKDSVDLAFKNVKNQINSDLNTIEFHKLIAPLVGLSREDHTNIYLPKNIIKKINEDIDFLPFTFVFLDQELYCVKNGSNYQDIALEGKKIELINGETPLAVAKKLGTLFASDGFIKTSKLNDLRGFRFSKYYFYYYGQLNEFNIKFKGISQPITVSSLPKKVIINNLKNRYSPKVKTSKKLLEFKILENSTAYIGIHSFSNDDISEIHQNEKFASFLENSFASIEKQKIENIIVDVSKNGGGSEGNESLLYSYFGKNYKKYKKVRAKTQKAVLDNGVDAPITLTTFGFLERTFLNKKCKDGSFERRENVGKGLMAFKKEPKYKFEGKTYIIISPSTYSGASEFSNMMYTQNLATFVGQETGGGYYGNTSGYSKELILPNSKIKIYVPALQFVMNVKPLLPFGSGVKPLYKVVPTFNEYVQQKNVSLTFILDQIKEQNTANSAEKTKILNPSNN